MVSKLSNMNYGYFISKRFFFDMELIYLYTQNKKKIISVPVKYKISNSSSINLLNLSLNFKIVIELIKVLSNIIFLRIRS